MRILIALIVYLVFTGPLMAQEAPALVSGSKEPLEITADHTLEWHRLQNHFIARGNAVAKQGETVVRGETLVANYRETEDSSFEIYLLTAEGNVAIETPGNTAKGSKATYNIDTGVAVMTGDNLLLIAPEQTVTADDRFEYYVHDGRLTAEGNAFVKRGADSLRADRLSAFFTKDYANKTRLSRISADGNIVIRTPTETLYGDQGEYLASTQIAEVTGNVRIERGPNVLEGERAEVNLSTHISKIHGDQAQGGRVRGVFYPESKQQSEPE